MDRPSAPRGRTRVVDLLGASHPGPTIAVTVVTGGLAAATGRPLVTGLVVTAAVLAGQLSIGWLNDLVDADRDRAVGRQDKPVASGVVGRDAVRRATGAALAVAAVLSLLGGVASAATHLVLVVGSGWAYDLRLKRSVASPAPYAVAFGALPSVVTLAGPDGTIAPAWMSLTAGLLGVAAHFLNVLPDLADDAATGVSGAPHRMGERASRVAALGLLVIGTVVAVLGPGRPPTWAVAGAVVVVALGVVGAFSGGRRPFLVGVVIAVVDLAMLLVRSATS